MPRSTNKAAANPATPSTVVATPAPSFQERVQQVANNHSTGLKAAAAAGTVAGSLEAIGNAAINAGMGPTTVRAIDMAGRVAAPTFAIVEGAKFLANNVSVPAVNLTAVTAAKDATVVAAANVYNRTTAAATAAKEATVATASNTYNRTAAATQSAVSRFGQAFSAGRNRLAGALSRYPAEPTKVTAVEPAIQKKGQDKAANAKVAAAVVKAAAKPVTPAAVKAAAKKPAARTTRAQSITKKPAARTRSTTPTRRVQPKRK